MLYLCYILIYVPLCYIYVIFMLYLYHHVILIPLSYNDVPSIPF
jgi:hypothetical protein